MFASVASPVTVTLCNHIEMVGVVLGYCNKDIPCGLLGFARSPDRRRALLLSSQCECRPKCTDFARPSVKR